MMKMSSVNELAAKIRLLLMDVDGVLTDGKLYNVEFATFDAVKDPGKSK